MFSCSNGVPSAACGDADWSSRCLRIEATDVKDSAPISTARRLTASARRSPPRCRETAAARQGGFGILVQGVAAGPYRDDQPLGVRPNATGVALEHSGVHSACSGDARSACARAMSRDAARHSALRVRRPDGRGGTPQWCGLSPRVSTCSRSRACGTE